MPACVVRASFWSVFAVPANPLSVSGKCYAFPLIELDEQV
jgi:hypothetical protein